MLKDATSRRPIPQPPRGSLGRRGRCAVSVAVGTLVSREWVRFIRQRNRVVGAVGQPIIFWLLFGAGLGPSFRMPGPPAIRSPTGPISFPARWF